MKKIAFYLMLFGLTGGLQAEQGADDFNAMNAALALQADTQLQSKLLNDGKLPRATVVYYNNRDRAKIDSLNGKWQLSYSANGTQKQTDLLELDSVFDDKNFGFYGWDGKHSMSCFYEPNILGTIYNYQCLRIVDANTGTAQRYLFNLTGNTLSGKYYIGSVEGFITSIRNNQLITLEGCDSAIAGACAAKPVTSSNESVYNDKTSEVIIPRIMVFGKPYRAILQNEGNGILKVKEFVAL